MEVKGFIKNIRFLGHSYNSFQLRLQPALSTLQRIMTVILRNAVIMLIG